MATKLSDKFRAVTTGTFDEVVLASPAPVAVDFWASW